MICAVKLFMGVIFMLTIIGINIKRIRTEKNFSQKYLADKMGVHRNSINNWENGVSVPHSKHVGLLCETLGIHVDELLLGKVQKDTTQNIRYIHLKKMSNNCLRAIRNNNITEAESCLNDIIQYLDYVIQLDET